MHIILGILGSIVTILFYLSMISRSGVNFGWIGWLNPFAWQRRRAWRQIHQTDPIYKITSPMEATACLMYAMARCFGDVTREQKTVMLESFRQEFHLSERDAADMLAACSYLVADDQQVINNLERFFEPNLAKFSEEQKRSAVELVEKVARAEGSPIPQQQDFIDNLGNVLFPPANTSKKWS